MFKKNLKITGSVLLVLAAIFLFAWASFATASPLNKTLEIIAGIIFILAAVIILQTKTLQRKILIITGRFFLIVFAIILLLWLLIQTETVQNFIVGKVTAKLSKDLHTEVTIKHVSFSLFDKMNLEGALVRDKQKDTLLYAGSLKVRITDWFFLKDKADITYIGLEDAVIKQQRKDSVWNTQFLVDYFSSSKKQKDTTPGLQIHLQKIDLKNVVYIKNDLWQGQKLTAKAGSMLLDADDIGFDTSVFNINEIDLDKPYFSIQNFDALNPDTSSAETKDTGMYFNPGNIALKIKTIKITNGSFVNENLDGSKPLDHFDGSHIMISKIDGIIAQVSFIKDTIRANIDITAKERSGVELKKLKTNFRLTPQIMELAHLDLRTNKSRLGDYYAMKFKDFNEDMQYYVERIVMNADFKNSTVSTDDIAYFAPELKSWKKQYDISGKFSGTVQDFKSNDLFVRSGAAAYAAGTLAMKGLPDINKTTINFTNATVQASYNDVAAFIPSLKNISDPNFAALGVSRFTGNFSGTIHNFSATGNISTAIGSTYANINMQFPRGGEPAYKGTVITNQFNLGKFINTNSLGLISFNGKISGSSFDISKIKTTVNGNFSRFDFNDYSYSDISFDGTIKNKFFTGDFKASDPNFDFTSNIEIDLKEAQPKFNILGDLATANFKQLKFSNDSFQLTGLFDLNFQGRNIDEFTGTAKVLNASLVHDSTKLDFDSLVISSHFDSANRKILRMQSNQFNASVNGQYNILDLPNNFQAFLSHYFPSYISQPKTTPQNQDFFVVIKTKDFSKYAQVIDARLSGLDSALIAGSINTKDSGIFHLRIKVPEVKYDKYKFEDADISGKGDFTALNLDGNIGRIFIGDSTYFPNTKIGINSQNDHSVVHISTSANNTLNEAELNADVYTLPDGVRIDFDPSSFVINDKKWELEKEGELIIRKSFSSAKNVKFVQGFQEITVETEDEDGGNTNNLAVKLKDLNIGDFTPIITKQPRLEGVANGSIYLRDFYGPFTVDAALNLTQFRLNDDSVGIVPVKALYDSKTGKVSFDVLSDNDKYNFTAKGFYNTKDSANAPFSTTFNLNGTKITILNQFLGDLFSNIDGEAYGPLTIKGNPSSPDLLGNVTLKGGSLLVNYTKVRYFIDSAVFNFSDGMMDFGNFNIRDELNNVGTIRGKLYEHELKNMRFDLSMNTNKLLLLNTTEKDNQQFYGRAIGKGSLSLTGPQQNLKMSITGEVNDTTHIFIPETNSKESSDVDFIRFKQYGTEIKEEQQNDDTKLSIDLDLTANNKAQIDVILDPLTGDVIKATGNGRVQIKIPADGKMTMNGRYNIERGSYDFNFQSFIRKPFDLLPDANNYIEWSGDPYNANIHIDAQYTATRVSLNDLVSNQGALNGTIKGYRGDVYVIAELTGKLTKPDIHFRLDFPAGSAIKNDNDFALFLNRMQADDNEMLKQVTYLIVFGSFAPYGEASGSGTNVTSLGLNTISQKITAEFNKLLSNVLYKITGDKSLQFDVGTSTYSSATLLTNGIGTSSNDKLDRQQVNLKVNQSLLDGKVIVTVGGDLDFNVGSATAQTGSFQWLPDVSIQIVLSKDRKLRAVIFNKSSLSVSNTNSAIGRTTRQGVSLSYTRDFEKLFGDKIKNPPPADSTKKSIP